MHIRSRLLFLGSLLLVFNESDLVSDFVDGAEGVEVLVVDGLLEEGDPRKPEGAPGPDQRRPRGGPRGAAHRQRTHKRRGQTLDEGREVRVEDGEVIGRRHVRCRLDQPRHLAVHRRESVVYEAAKGPREGARQERAPDGDRVVLAARRDHRVPLLQPDQAHIAARDLEEEPGDPAQELRARVGRVEDVPGAAVAKPPAHEGDGDDGIVHEGGGRRPEHDGDHRAPAVAEHQDPRDRAEPEKLLALGLLHRAHLFFRVSVRCL
mmetsp:Transcript_61434/g.139070  ORF Transcript_61434/g.139070 Transcript_61434/m.139070 type:complete len:263 (-) Transcript_61434:254-1042(-)